MTFIGRVKWFNNKAGYGFITVTDGEKSGEDVFVHHSGITVDSEQFKYLVQGEYVEFTIEATPEGSKHSSQATRVTGVKGGKLMCQTRNESRKEKKVVATTTNSEFQQPKGRKSKSYAKAVNPSASDPSNKAGRKFKDGETQTRGKKNAGKPRAKPTATNA